jgi:triacylglycerol lipase
MNDSEPSNYEFRTRSNSPIGEMDRLEQSLLFAELAKVSYFDADKTEELLRQVGITYFEFFDREGAQAYYFENETDRVIVCRGTEPDDINDVKADVNVVAVAAETVGRVHGGFKSECDHLWPMIEKAIKANDKPIWFAGHSLGGAMATICAGRCFLSHIEVLPSGLFTYGSPRVGNQRYINFCDINHIRWVNNNDIVPRMPPRWLGYTHSGTEMYMDRHGRLRKIYGAARSMDRLKGFGDSLLRLKIDQLSDHSIDEYVNALDGICQRRHANPPQP